jgi:hypothetical protein
MVMSASSGVYNLALLHLQDFLALAVWGIRALSLKDTSTVMDGQTPIAHSPARRGQQRPFSQLVFKIEFAFGWIKILANLIMKSFGTTPQTYIYKSGHIIRNTEIPSHPVVFFFTGWLAQKFPDH